MSDATRELLETLAKVLLRCWVIGMVLQLVTLLAVMAMGDVVHGMYANIFGLSEHESSLIIASYLALLKLVIATGFFIPWLATHLVLRASR